MAQLTEGHLPITKTYLLEMTSLTSLPKGTVEILQKVSQGVNQRFVMIG